jgi:uncharacterized membrane protein YhaH (DUF805 family)
MTFGEAIKSGFNNYASFKGRASRSEFWFWYLFVVLVQIIPSAWYSAEIVSKNTGFGTVLYAIVTLGLILPTLGMQIRRLHDTNRAGGWWWIGLVPLAGPIILLVFFLSPSVDNGNRFN